MVKKVFSFIVILLLVILCSCAYSNKVEKKSGSSDILSFSKDTGIIYNEEIARQIADAVFVNSLKKNLNEYKIINVIFEEKNNVWKIVYMTDKFTIGGDVTIQISRKNGEIDIYYGE